MEPRMMEAQESRAGAAQPLTLSLKEKDKKPKSRVMQMEPQNSGLHLQHNT